MNLRRLTDGETCNVEIEKWRLTFDGSSTHRGVVREVVFYAPDGTNTSLAFKLEFFCTNNEEEHETLIIGLIMP